MPRGDSHSSRLVAPYAPTEEEQSELRSRLSLLDSDSCDDGMLRRFLVAEKGDIASACSRIQDTLRWRREVVPENIACIHCLRDPSAHYLHPVGFSKGGSPVLYSCIAMATDRSTKGQREHMIMTFEQSVKLMPPGVERWIWVADCEGFSMKDVGGGTAKAFLELAAKHYPERLEKFLIVNPPKVFIMLWNSMQPLLDPVTKQKINYDVNREHSVLMDAFDGELSEQCKDWLLTEMAENRSKNKRTKHYSQQDLVAAFKTDAPYEHHWGTEPLLDCMKNNPEVLESVEKAILSGGGAESSNSGSQ